MTTILAFCLLSVMGGGTPMPRDDGAVAPIFKGTLIVDGGGKASPIVKKRSMALAGGPKARVVILTHASNLPEAGPKAEIRWREAGAEVITILRPADSAKVVIEAISQADIVWISGGDQERLMGRLEGTGIPEAIVKRYRDGGIVGGASAGAAVMSEVMIGRSAEDFPHPLCDYPIPGRGLGLWAGVIVDQHFLKLRRTPRLKRVLEEFPGLVGVGIDESTAAIVRGRTIEVVGDSKITIIDPRKPPSKLPVITVNAGGGDGPMPPALSPEAAAPAVLTLNPGMTFDLDRGMISEPITEMR